MKKSFILISFLISLGVLFHSCKKEDEIKDENSSSIIPKSFKVDIPNSISSSST